MDFGTFNLLLRTRGNETLVFNTLTETCVSLPNDTLEQLQLGLVPSTLTEEDVDFLKSHLILVENKEFERAFLLYETNTHRFGNSTLKLNLYTTYRCNLGCNYCYEKQAGTLNSVDMTHEVADTVVAWVEDYLEGRAIREICWTYYGGEPTLNPEKILRLGSGLRRLCESNNLRYRSRIVTNGTLLTPDLIKTLTSFNLSQAQITLDGPKDVHDQQRFFRGGGGTYDRILDNMSLLRDSGATLVMRINVDSVSLQHIPRLLEDVSVRRPLDLSSIHLQVVPIFSCNWHAKVWQHELPDDEYSRIVDIYRYGLSLGFRMRHPGSANHCSATSANSFEVDPFGGIYSCAVFASSRDQNWALGKTDSSDFNSLYFSLLSTPILDECAQCPYLPVCQMGCRAELALKTGRVTGRVCHKERLERYLVPLLELYYSSEAVR